MHFLHHFILFIFISGVPLFLLSPSSSYINLSHILKLSMELVPSVLRSHVMHRPPLPPVAAVMIMKMLPVPAALWTLRLELSVYTLFPCYTLPQDGATLHTPPPLPSGHLICTRVLSVHTGSHWTPTACSVLVRPTPHGKGLHLPYPTWNGPPSYIAMHACHTSRMHLLLKASMHVYALLLIFSAMNLPCMLHEFRDAVSQNTSVEPRALVENKLIGTDLNCYKLLLFSKLIIIHSV